METIMKDGEEFMKEEPYCCTCGIFKNVIIYENKTNNGASTMCDKCLTEEANYCCKCGIKIEKKNLCLCDSCYSMLRYENL